jgi:hypothetical protein
MTVDFEQPEAQPEKPKGKSAKAPKAPKPEIVEDFQDEPVDDWGKKKHYQEWTCRVTGGKAEKLKMTRPRVMITDQQAEILNEGVLNGNNKYAQMYFRPE